MEYINDTLTHLVMKQKKIKTKKRAQMSFDKKHQQINNTSIILYGEGGFGMSQIGEMIKYLLENNKVPSDIYLT